MLFVSQSAIGNTAHEAVLKLRSLVAGTYYFTLNVTDAKGASNTDTVVVTVAKGRSPPYLAKSHSLCSPGNNPQHPQQLLWCPALLLWCPLQSSEANLKFPHRCGP